MKYSKLFYYFIFSFFVCERVSAEFLQSNSEVFIADIQKLNQNGKNEKILNEILIDFKDLEGRGYGDTNPLFWFYLGKIYKENGKLKNDAQSLRIAANYFNKLELITKENNQLSTYRAAVVMDAYTLSDIASILNESDFADSKNKIDNFIKEYPDLVDGTVILCKANIYNSSGYYFYKNGIYKKALKDLAEACKYKGVGWPVFANNFINACLEAYDQTNDPFKKTQYLNDALKIFKIHKGESYWINVPKFTKTGKLLEKYLKKNGIDLNQKESKVSPDSK